MPWTGNVLTSLYRLFAQIGPLFACSVRFGFFCTCPFAEVKRSPVLISGEFAHCQVTSRLLCLFVVVVVLDPVTILSTLSPSDPTQKCKSILSPTSAVSFPNATCAHNACSVMFFTEFILKDGETVIHLGQMYPRSAIYHLFISHSFFFCEKFAETT